jgi:outer membrane murein-binding lipoprotein Lpp
MSAGWPRRDARARFGCLILLPRKNARDTKLKSGKNRHANKSFCPSSTGRPADGGTAVRRQLLPPGQGMQPAKIAGNHLSVTREAMASRVEAMASHAEAMASHVEAMASHAEAMASHAEAMTSHVEAMASHVEAMASRVELVGSARHFGADYADLLGFSDKVEFDPWPEPPTGEVFENNQDWSARQKLQP